MMSAARGARSAARLSHRCSGGDNGSVSFQVNSRTYWLSPRDTRSPFAYSTRTVGVALILTLLIICKLGYLLSRISLWPFQFLRFNQL